MKAFVCLFVFIGFAVVGLAVFFRAKGRVNFYTGLLSFCHHLQTEISFTLTPIAQIIDRYLYSYPREFANLLRAYQTMLNSKTDVTADRCRQMTTDTTVADFFYSLGRARQNEERDKISNAIGVFTATRIDAEAYLKNRATVTLKICILAGIAGVILLL